MGEMRKSTAYLMSIPFKFAAMLSMVFIVIYGFFKFLEFSAKGTGMISGHLLPFALLLASFFAIDGLAIMLMEYATRRLSETCLLVYLKTVDEQRALARG